MIFNEFIYFFEGGIYLVKGLKKISFLKAVMSNLQLVYSLVTKCLCGIKKIS